MHVVRAAASRAVLSLALVALLAPLAPSPARAAGLSLVVDTTADDRDADNGQDDICQTAAGKCSLRAAIQTADHNLTGDTITVPAGTYTLSQPFDANDTNGTYGDLDIAGDLTIKGAGAGKTIIQGSTTDASAAVDRIFDVRTQAAKISISGVTLRFGKGTNYGGAIVVSASGAVLTLSSVTLDRNQGVSSGGAIYGGGVLSITASTISGNRAGSASAIDWSGNATITTTTISGNVSTSVGAEGALRLQHAVGAASSTFLIDRSVVTGNTSAGAVAAQLGNGADSSYLKIRNSTIAGNTATGSDGPVIDMTSTAQLEFESSTIASNAAFRVVYPWAKANVTAKDTIFGKNGAANCDAPITSLGHNIDAGSSCGLTGTGDKSSTAPMLGALAANGGPTKTMALLAGSPAIDAGAGCPTVDQRGQTRPKDGDGDGVAACDIGAYEAKAVAVVATASPAPTASPTPEPTEAPTVAPTAAATAAPSAAPTPAATPAVTAAPTVTGDAGGGSGSLPLLLIVAAVIVGVVAFALSRRRGSGAATGS